MRISKESTASISTFGFKSFKAKMSLIRLVFRPKDGSSLSFYDANEYSRWSKERVGGVGYSGGIGDFGEGGILDGGEGGIRMSGGGGRSEVRHGVLILYGVVKWHMMWYGLVW